MEKRNFSLPLSDSDRSYLKMHAVRQGKSPNAPDDVLVAIWNGVDPAPVAQASLDAATIAGFAGRPYAQVAQEVIGPFMGCMTRGRGVESWMELFLPLTVTMAPLGSPRSQARPSRSVSRWQLAQLAVPLPESLASKR